MHNDCNMPKNTSKIPTINKNKLQTPFIQDYDKYTKINHITLSTKTLSLMSLSNTEAIVVATKTIIVK